MYRINFKTIKGNHIVTVNGVRYNFKSIKSAFKFVFEFKQRM